MSQDVEWTEAWERAVTKAWREPAYHDKLTSPDLATVVAALKEVGYTVHPDVRTLKFETIGQGQLDPTPGGPHNKDTIDAIVPLPQKPTGFQPDTNIDATHWFQQMNRRAGILC